MILVVAFGTVIFILTRKPKITYEYWLVHIIKPRDKVMLEYLGYWLKDLKDYNIDLIFYIRVKSAGNEEFLKWWNEYDFKLSKEPLL